MEPRPDSVQRVGSAARTGAVGTVVGAVAFFDGVFIGAPIALLATTLRPLLVYAVANPILIGALARLVGGTPVGRRRIVLGAVAYAIPYCAMWTIVGLALGDTLRG